MNTAMFLETMINVLKFDSNTKHHLKHSNLFGIFCTVLHTASSEGDSLPVGQYSSSTKSARKSFTAFKRCLV